MSLAREVVAELVPLADAGHIDLGVAAAQPVSLSGDPDALRTLLRNLIDNAVRYTPAGGRVDVTVEAAPGGTPHGSRRWSGYRARGALAGVRSLLSPRRH